MEVLESKWKSCGSVLEASVRVLLKFPLCDRCLGRLFARLGRGLDNSERGRAIKTLLAMLLSEELLSKEELEVLAVNGGLPVHAPPGGEVRQCYVCRSELDRVIVELGEKAVRRLREVGFEVTGFLVGVKTGSEFEKREREVIGLLGLDTWESVRREVKRVVGKYISKELSIPPDFINPDVLVIVDLVSRDVYLKPLPLLLRGRYVKIGRYVSQLPWYRRNGSRKYKLSIHDICAEFSKIFGGEDFVLHAAGREDADARMLGDGRPVAIEIKNPTRRSFSSARSQSVELPPWIRVEVSGRTTREYVREIKSRSARKTYRVVVFVAEGLTEKDISKISSLSNTVVHQRTPTRVLRRRRKDVARRRRVYDIALNVLSKYLLEVLVSTDGGLYVKEFISGDGGRTTPSFSEVIGKSAEAVLLDVVKVESML
ncbi:MAG: tRNA pseudouridine(54/55) synthase Pus10 [Sulfolobales archaeon]|nr:tRNA pseudouridine(54/55) synthase Pus10 [Sulfolobales archaeon]MCX8208355.1 tRNA pseudouridine(54/55) synthase Pus10 [Sulfolobales archaeon]MDW8010099.1 tRNA pseudouridine(54/55) synthase Pus10 [Sulfolobales archaeon]